MKTRTISSTEAQNNFGRVLDSSIQEGIVYIIERRGNAQAVLLSLANLDALLDDENILKNLGSILKEVSPKYDLGRTIEQD